MTAIDAPQSDTGRGVRAEVSGLRVRLAGRDVNVVDGVSFTARGGEVLGLVGESGSGKTTVALSLLGHVRRGLEVAGGSVLVGGTDVVHAPGRVLRALRGAEVAYVPQDPTSALNPALRVGNQLVEGLRAHRQVVERKQLGTPEARAAEALDEAGLADVPGLMKAYPHQLSGGQQQRVALAMAFALRPGVIVLDEPTTGLDVTTQRRILDTVKALCRSYGVAAVYVSHDLAVVSGLADRLLVLYGGQVMEDGATASVFGTPSHPYTRSLLRAVPSTERSEVLAGIAGQAPHPTQRPSGCVFAPRCPLVLPECTTAVVPLTTVGRDHHVRCIRDDVVTNLDLLTRAAPARTEHDTDTPVLSVSRLSAAYGAKQVLSGIDLTAQRNECLAVVGESGSGKTTLARCLVGLHRSWTGEVTVRGEVVARTAQHRTREQLRTVQFIFQNPYTALNPRKTIGQIVEQPLAHFFPELRRDERAERVEQVLSEVALGGHFWDRYPDQLSGGERQRVAIARALITSPELLVCDEITSALDVSVQATIVELLRRLQQERNLSLVFITHNLALVRSIAQAVVVVADGHVVEAGPVATVFDDPKDPYTVRLMHDVPKLTVT